MKVPTCLPAVVAAGLALGNPLQAPETRDASAADIGHAIKKLIVLVMENQSFDRLYGVQSYDPTLRGIDPRHPPCYDANATDPNNHEEVCATPDATNLIPEDPDHSYPGTTYSLYESFTPDDQLIQAGRLKPNMRGCVTRQGMVYNIPVNESSLVARYYKPQELPVLTTLAKEFGFCTNDDRILGGAITATSIFEAVTEKGLTYKDYSDSPIPDSADYNWTHSTGHLTNIHPISQLFVDLTAGHLPDLAYIKAGSNLDMHPPANMSNGEGFVKLVYDNLRASEFWEETLLIITWDEAGGHCDHYPPPQTGIPRPDNFVFTTEAPDGTNTTFKFDRLGPRVASLLVSPYVGRGIVEHDGRNNGGVYTHTSWLKFASNLWGLKGLDSPRIEWSATWEHLITPEARQDTPVKLPMVINPESPTNGN